MLELITASNAKEIALINQLRNTITLLNNAIEEGRLHIGVGNINDTTIKYFQDRGYLVVSADSRSEHHYIISWDN